MTCAEVFSGFTLFSAIVLLGQEFAAGELPSLKFLQSSPEAMSIWSSAT